QRFGVRVARFCKSSGHRITQKRGTMMPDDGFVLERSPSHLLHRAQQLAAGEFQRALGSDKVTIRQFAVLAAIAGKPARRKPISSTPPASIALRSPTWFSAWRTMAC